MRTRRYIKLAILTIIFSLISFFLLLISFKIIGFDYNSGKYYQEDKIVIFLVVLFSVAAGLAARSRLAPWIDSDTGPLLPRTNRHLALSRLGQDLAAIGTWRVDAETRRIAWSPAMREMFGIEEAEMRDMAQSDVLALLDADSRKRADRLLNRLLTEGEPYRTDVTVNRPNGETRLLLINATPEYDRHGTIVAAIGTGRDVTAEARLTAELTKFYEQFKTVTDNMPVMFAYLDSDLRFRFVNHALEKWYAASANDLIGRRPSDFHDRTQYDFLEEGLHKAVGGEEAAFEGDVTYPDGRSRSVEIRYIPDKSASDEVRGVFAIVLDVTKRVSAERKYHLSQRMEAIGLLSSQIAHDLNNSLGIAKGSLRLLEKGIGQAEDRKMRHWIGQIASAIESGEQSIDRLISFSRGQPSNATAFDVGACLKALEDILTMTLGHSARLEMTIADGLPRVSCDRAALETALVNLTTNAKDACAAGGGTVRVAVECLTRTLDGDEAPRPYIVIHVGDDGAGMDRETRQKALEPFFTTKEDGKGTGLGLSAVYDFARKSGGDLKIESEPGQGTRITLLLPSV